MCGIVGYIGTSQQPVALLLDSLKTLEYRGYDSAGLSFLTAQQQLSVFKSTGKLSNLAQQMAQQHINLPPQGQVRVGIGHIRWATHGAPTQTNAHPHQGQQKTVSLVHNGIIENFSALKDMLQRQGRVFESDTDTECVVQLLEAEASQSSGGSPDDFIGAIQRTLPQLEGAYALAFLHTGSPDTLFVARKKAPLVIGLLDNGEWMVASDTVALAAWTQRVIYLNDDEFAAISPSGLKLFSFKTGQWQACPIPEAQIIQTEALLLDKKGFKHYMLKEIYEQPDVVRNALSGRILDATQPVSLFSTTLLESLKDVNRLVIIGCGTSYNAGLLGKYAIEALVGIPAEVEAAGEYRYRQTILTPNTLFVVISQSGETADSLEAMRLAQKRGAKALVITNREDSTMAREGDLVIAVRAGVEVSVAATKSFTAQVIALYLLAVTLAEQRQHCSTDLLLSIKRELLKVPTLMEQNLSDLQPIQAAAKALASTHSVFFMARGMNVPVALEGALKLKEISYIHAEGYSASELKHGPIAMLDHHLPVVAVITPGLVCEKMLSNCQEARARDARLFAITTDAHLAASKEAYLFEHIITLSGTQAKCTDINELLSPLLTTMPLQLLAYAIAEHLGKDVDQPRNLAKSVTVE